MADTYEVVRTQQVDAPPAVVFDQLVDFHRWTAWSPWEDLDPALNRTYSGPESGVGATYAWSGNRKAGQGEMAVLEAEPTSLVRIRIQFLKPFKSLNQSTFTLQPSNGGTLVNWTMTGPMNVSTRIMSIFKSMDALIGPDFEKGLLRLKGVAESSSS